MKIEDGTGVDGAQAYADAAWCLAYSAGRGHGCSVDGPALVRATAWLDAAYRWPGERTHGRDQGLQWPRRDVTDAGGAPVPADEVPVEVKRAMCLAAILEKDSPGALSPNYTPAERVQSATVVGAVSVTYASSSAEDVRLVVSSIDDVLAPLIGRRNRAGAIFGEALRA